MSSAEFRAEEPGTDRETVERVLARGEITVTGRLSEASNLTLVGVASLDGVDVTCVYKPVRGERPLWDFPDGTLAQREYAAYLVAAAAGWDCVPRTLLRPGPFGAGMVQEWIDTPAGRGEGGELVDLVGVDDVPKGWKAVLKAVDHFGADVAIVHADDPGLAVLAGFDIIVNNADRKGVHVLTTADGRVYGVDHGLCFHQEEKLRTILWGWAGEALPDAVVEGLAKLARAMNGDLGQELDELLTVQENKVLRRRLARLRTTPLFPEPPAHRTPIPWPPL